MSLPLPPENFSSRVLAVLSLPLIDRLQELNILFERCTVRQIQEVYPLIVHSIFGINGNPLGWGLRTTTMENGPHFFSNLQHFFNVNGIWMQMCHKLLSDATKFEIDISLLPLKFVEMLQTGQNPMFYADLINIDPFKRQVSSLSLNSFDFYMFHFVFYALQPLHSINPIALQVHNERTKTVYQLLVSEYLCNYLPLVPDAIIEPAVFCGPVKAPQPLPAQALQPQRLPRFIKIPTSFHNDNVSVAGSSVSGNTSPQLGALSISRAHAWRSESVLHFFVDIWLRYDIEAEHHLPSSDYVRGVRTLIKQVHFFHNTAQLDQSSLCALRKTSLAMVKARIYAFLCSLIDRWPLDSSLVVVLELWLSYIQPWRYTLAAANNRINGISCEQRISASFDGFIMDNLIVYTHIFIQLLPRFERLDYTVYRNAYTLYRLAKMFAQQDLIERLQKFERLHSGNTFGFDSPQRQVNLVNKSSGSYNAQWNPLVSTHIPKLFSEHMHNQIESFLFVISMARNTVLRDICELRNEITERQRSEGFIKNLLNKLFAETTQDELTLREVSRIPELLRQGIDAFCNTFKVNPMNLSMHETLLEAPSPEIPSSQNFSFFDSCDSLDTSKLTPHQMSLNASNLQPTVDPALIPIQSNEIKYLVRLLHVISEAINNKFGSQIVDCYAREDYLGRISRKLLYPPMTEQWFDKQCGNVAICEKQLPARVCLRPLGSVPVLFIIGCSLLLGQVCWAAPIVGLYVLCLLYLAYVMVAALLS